MASLKRNYEQRYSILVWSVLEIFLFSALVFGWAALVVVLKQENVFGDLCEYNDEGNRTKDCTKQDERLNLVFLIGGISFASNGVVSGAFLDHFGPRKTRLLSRYIYTNNKPNEGLIYCSFTCVFVCLISRWNFE